MQLSLRLGGMSEGRGSRCLTVGCFVGSKGVTLSVEQFLSLRFVEAHCRYLDISRYSAITCRDCWLTCVPAMHARLQLNILQ